MGQHSAAVYVRITEVIQDQTRLARPGAILARVRPMGTVVIDGRELCSERPFDTEDTRLGDTVLIGGRPETGGSELFFPLFEFRVVDGQIQPGQATFATDALPKSLEQLWAEYNGDPLKGVLP